ncbi:MAG: chorismate synthase [Coriobacteriales bacterium]|jgi:chorismate synthase
MRYTSAGESHGRALTTIVAGVPAGISLSTQQIDDELHRRQLGYGRGGRMKIESDHAQVLSGVRFGKTLGSPISILIENRDFEHWTDRMAVDGEPPEDLVKEQTPRPGHADLVGVMKIGSDDCRDVLERASARETACRVAAGAVAKAMLSQLGVTVGSYVTRIGTASIPLGFYESSGYVFDNAEVDKSAVRTPDQGATTFNMKNAIDAAKSEGQSLGGWFNVTATGLVPGLGGYAQADDRLTSRLAGAVFSIPAIKGVEFGLGFEAGKRVGGEVHDPISYDEERGYFRTSNNAGGLEGGMTTGEPLIIRACMKPIPTLTSPLPTIHLGSHEPVEASKERSDVCAVPAAAVVAEAEVAIVLADAYQRKFGGDCMQDMLAAIESYKRRIRP